MTTFATIRYETSSDKVATITLDRPEVLNAFDRTMCEEVRTAWRLVKEDADVHAVVLRAEGDRAFCAGLVNRNAPLAVRGTRLAIRKGMDIPLHEAEIMAEAFRERVVRTDDAKEGPAAFMEKRAPRWTAS